MKLCFTADLYSLDPTWEFVTYAEHFIKYGYINGKIIQNTLKF